MKVHLLCLISLSLFFNGLAQKNIPIKRIDGSTIKSTELTDQLKHIVDTGRITGLSMVIINEGKIVYQKTFGKKNTEKNEELNDSAEMYAASFTKPVSAYLFLKLADHGIFNLDTPLIKYLKNPVGSYEKWKDLASDKAFEIVTPRMILSHSSGMPILRFIYHDKVNLIAEPGSKFYYSNEGMNLLGFIMEEFTGKTLQEMTAELIFNPLGMDRTSMVWQPSFDKNYALGYDKSGNVVGVSKRSVAKAAGSMTTTAGDYAKFIIAIMEKKGISQKASEEMFMPQIKIIAKRGFGPLRDSLETGNTTNISWGLGFGLFNTKIGNAYFHGGHDDGWQNYFVAYPDKKIAIIIMTNSSNFEHAAPQILNLAIGDTYSPFEWMGYYDNNE